MRQAGLTAIQVILGDPVLRLKQAKDVRWLSHQAAVETLAKDVRWLSHQEAVEALAKDVRWLSHQETVEALAKDVRWLSHQEAVEALRGSLVSVLTSLDREAPERSEPTASGLLNFMKKYNFVAALSLFADVLPHLSKLCQTLQSSSLDFSILETAVNSCINSIEHQVNNPGKYLVK